MEIKEKFSKNSVFTGYPTKVIVKNKMLQNYFLLVGER